MGQIDRIARKIKSSNKKKAQDAIKDLIEIGRKDPKTQKDIMKVIASYILSEKGDNAIRYIVTAGIIGREFPKAVKPLIIPLAKKLLTENDEMQYKTAYSLYLIAGNMPGAIKDAIPTMVNLLDSMVKQGAYPQFKSYKQYTTILQVFKLVAEKHPTLLKKAIPVLIKCIDYPIYHPENPSIGLSDFYPEVVNTLARLSIKFPHETENAIPLLVRAYIDTYRYHENTKLLPLRSAVLEAMEMIAQKNSAGTLEYILEYMSNPNNYGRKVAEELISPVFKHPGDVAKTIIKTFDSKNSDLKEKASSVLDKLLRTNPKNTIGPLKSALKKGTVEEKKYILNTISITAKSRIDIAVNFVTELTQGIKDPSPEIRWFAADTLGTIGSMKKKLAPSIVKYIVRLLNDENHQVRWSAISAMARIGMSYGTQAIENAIPGIIKLADDPYDQVRWKAIDTLKRLKIDRYRHSQITEDLKIIQKEIDDMKPLISNEEYQELTVMASKIIRYLGNLDYRAAEKALSNLKDNAAEIKLKSKDDDRIKAAGVLKELRIMKESAVANSIPSENLDKMIEEAKNALMAGNYDTIYKLRADMKEEIKRLETPPKSTKTIDTVNLWEVINWLENEIMQEKVRGSDITEARSLIDKAKRAMDIGVDTTVVMGYITDAKIALKNSRKGGEQKAKRIAQEAIASALTVITSAKAKNLDISKAEQYMSEAELGIKQEDYTKAVKLASKAEEEALKVLKISMLGQASEHLIEIQNWIKDAENFGLDVSDALKLMGEAKKAFKNDDFESVEKIIRMIRDNLDKQKSFFIRNQAKTLFNSIIVQLKEGEAENLDLSDLHELKLSAEEAFNEGRYEDLYELSIKIGEQIEALRHSKAKEEAVSTVEQAEKKVAHLSKLGLVTDDINARMNKAKEYLNKEMYAQAKSYASELNLEIETILEVGYKSALRAKLSDSRSKVDKMETVGYDVMALRDLLQQAMDSFDRKEYEDVEDKLSEIAGSIMEMEHLKEVEDSTAKFFRIKAEKELKELEQKELSPEAREMYELAKWEFENKNYTDALKKAKKAKRL